MKLFDCSVLALCATLVSASALAGDYPAAPEPDVSAAAPDRLRTARNAIGAKDFKKAIAELKLAAIEMPKNADVHNLLGFSYRKQAQPELAKAFEHYNLALKLNPRHLGAHEYIGEAYLMDKKPIEAQKHLQQLQTLCGNQTCAEYVDLAKSLAVYKKANP